MSGRRLYIAKSGREHGPSLPPDAVTRTFGVLGQRGTGKTTAAVVLVEEIAKAGGHTVVLDPVGAWWGITRAGEKAGVKGIVIGGEHADVPLEEGGGTLVAELVAERHWPVVVVDMMLLRKGAQMRFMADFLEVLFHQNRDPLHVVFEEADRALPQAARNFDPTAGRVLGAGEDIVKLGRSRGLGATLVTQRPASVNKNVLEQVETLLLFRLMGPNDRKAIKTWVEANGDPQATQTVMDTMSSLKLGQCWLYSPSWLGHLGRARIRNRRTFDSSATPEVGQAREEPTKRAPVDLDQVREKMAATVQRQRENDPEALKARVAELEAEVAQAGERPAEVERVEVPVVDPDLAEQLADLVARMESVYREVEHDWGEAITTYRDTIMARVDEVLPVAEGIRAALSNGHSAVSRNVEGDGRATPAPPAARTSAPPAPTTTPPSEPPPVEGLKRMERALLATLVQFPEGRSRTQLAVLTGYSAKSGGFANALGRLRTAGYVEPPYEGTIRATDAGRAAMPEVPPAPTGAELLEMWKGKLKKMERVLLDILTAAYPYAVARDELAERAGYSAASGGFANALGRLRSAELIDPAPNPPRVSDAVLGQ